MSQSIPADLKFFLDNKKNFLAKTSKLFCVPNLVLKIGIELELYLLDVNSFCLEDEKTIDKYIADLKKILADNLLIYDIEKERGKGQIEIKISYISDFNLLCETIAEVKNLVQKLAKENNFVASFNSCPIVDDCSSAMQFNLSFHDENDKNLFVVDEKILQNSIAGILDLLSEMIIFCAPENNDYLRFNLHNNINLHKKGKFMAPINISFGVDNRSAAIRISRDKKRVEFRVASANCEYELVISSLIIAISRGIKENLKLKSSQKIYGNSFDKNYNLEELPQNFEQAKNNFFNKKTLKNQLLAFFY